MRLSLNCNKIYHIHEYDSGNLCFFDHWVLDAKEGARYADSGIGKALSAKGLLICWISSSALEVWGKRRSIPIKEPFAPVKGAVLNNILLKTAL